MNVMTGTTEKGPAPGPASGPQAVRTSGGLLVGARQRPGMRPWPLFSALGPVGALPTAPALARKFTTMVLGGWDMTATPGLVEAIELVASELATNVVRAATASDGTPLYHDDGRLTELWLRLITDRALLQVEVWDNLPPAAGLPALRHPGAEEEHGRGLALVDQLSHSWGCDQIPGLQAKSVWALLKAR